jgi:thymidylate synthase
MREEGLPMTPDETYLGLLGRALHGGEPVLTRNAPCRRLFGLREEFSRFPLVSVRKTAWKTALRELEWFLSGSDDIHALHPSARPWWVPWANAQGRVRFNYSLQLRNFAGHNGRVVDQVSGLLVGLRDHPFSRRHLLTTWNAADMASPDCPITNCHLTVAQAFADTRGALHLVTYQRSADLVCGLPHNWAQAWALLVWLASRSGRTPGSLVWVGGDVHLYECHLPLARRVLAQEPRGTPGLAYTSSGPDFRADDFSLDAPYLPALAERAEMVV